MLFRKWKNKLKAIVLCVFNLVKAFMIGSIDEVNRKITKLDRRLQSYTHLIAESRATDYSDDLGPLPSARDGNRAEHLEKERKDVNRFAGMYCVKSTFTPGLSERAKNISKISVNQSKQIPQSKKETGKPKFVELQQYPGYELTEVTPLPEDVPTLQILNMVTEASVNLNKKPSYRQEFERLFYSELSQALLCDLFWYVFLDKFQPSQHSQQRLFNRIAHNYVKLMMYSREPRYKDTFFRYYPTLMSQGLYAAYCEAFPDSYRQFGEDFKEYVTSLVTEWMAGTKPAPRSWLKWNMSMLEPENIKTREEILKQKNKKSTTMSFEFLDNLGRSSNQNLSIYSSNSALNQSGSLSSMKTAGSRRKGSVLHPSTRVSFRRKSVCPTQPHAVSTPRVSAEGKTSDTTKKSSGVDPSQLLEALTPIRELGKDADKKHRKAAMSLHTPVSFTGPKPSANIQKHESHPACKGPNFVRAVFNVQGQSPLVAHFLRMKNLESHSGTILLVQRTELENLPAYPF